MRNRRSRAGLEDRVRQAVSPRAKAIALYDLALFHDNNSREAQAVPLYVTAIRSGLPRKLNAQAHAWLASSLYKTGNRKHARARIGEARAITKDRTLTKFLDRLEGRLGLAKPPRGKPYNDR